LGNYVDHQRVDPTVRRWNQVYDSTRGTGGAEAHYVAADRFAECAGLFGISAPARM